MYNSNTLGIVSEKTSVRRSYLFTFFPNSAICWSTNCLPVPRVNIKFNVVLWISEYFAKNNLLFDESMWCCSNSIRLKWIRWICSFFCFNWTYLLVFRWWHIIFFIFLYYGSKNNRYHIIYYVTPWLVKNNWGWQFILFLIDRKCIYIEIIFSLWLTH